MRNLKTVLCLLILISAVSCRGKSVIPDKPAQRDYVFDFADMIEPNLEGQLKALGRTLQEKTTAELVLVTIPTREDLPITKVAYELFNTWGLGDARKHNGCLLLIVKDNLLKGKKGKVRIEVGKGLEGRLNDAKCGRILDDLLLPGFAKNPQVSPEQAMRNSYTFLAQEIAAEYNVDLNLKDAVTLPERRSEPVSPVAIILTLICLFIIFGGRIGRRGIYFGGFGGSSYGGGFGGGYSGGGDFGGGSSGGGGADR